MAKINKTADEINQSIDFADELRKLKTPSEIESAVKYGMKSYSTTAEIESLLPAATGERIENRERANAQYTLAAENYTALPGDIMAANGRVWALQINGEVNAEWFGVVGDDTGDYSTEMQNAVDRLNQRDNSEKGGKLRLGSGIYRACLALDGRVMLEGAGRGATVLKQPAGKNQDVLTVPSTASLVGWSRLTIDANASENTSGRAIYVEATGPGYGNSFQPYNDKVDSGDYSYKHIVSSDFVAGFSAGDGIFHEPSNFQIFYDKFTVSHCAMDGFKNQASDGIYSNFYIEKNGRTGLWAQGGSNKYSNGKVIWNGRTDKTYGNIREQGSSNVFVDVEAQDAYTDGILILGHHPTFIGCKSNQNGYLAPGQEGFSDESSADWRIGGSATGITVVAGRAYNYKSTTGSDGLWTTQYPYYFNSYNSSQIKYFQVSFDSSTYNESPNVEIETLTNGRMGGLSIFSSNGSDSILDIIPQSPDGLGDAILRLFRSTSTTGSARFDMHEPNTSNVQNRFDAKGNTILNSRSGNVIIGGGSWNNGHVTLGSYHLWVDSTGDLRIKLGNPASDTDGTIVGTQS